MQKKLSSFISILSISLIFIACSSQKKEIRVLPIYGEREVNYKMVDGKKVADTIFHTVPPFRYLNQDSVWIDQSLVKNKVYFVDFFFTSCPSICPKMTSQIKRIIAKTKDIESLYHVFSFSIDPDRDTPQKFRKYIADNGLSMSNWDMLTGDEKATNELGVKGFIVHSGRNDEVQGGFAHSSSIVLIDRLGRIRGIFNGTDTKEMDDLEIALRKLLKEEYGEAIRE